MTMSFADLPKPEKVFLIEGFGLTDDEESLMLLKYVEEASYSTIAAELGVSRSSVGAMLTRVRKHMVSIAKELYPIADDRTRHLIDVLGWLTLEWPTMKNRNK